MTSSYLGGRFVQVSVQSRYQGIYAAFTLSQFYAIIEMIPENPFDCIIRDV